MDPYATAQLTGGRAFQCDATAVRTGPNGVRAYVLLDGIGTSQAVRDWTRKTAGQLAGYAARRGDAESALRALYGRLQQDPSRQNEWTYDAMPKAAAVVAVTSPGGKLLVAWAGDARAYKVVGGRAQRMTKDHNLRRVFPPTAVFPTGGNRNRITSCLGSMYTDVQRLNEVGHPAIETAAAFGEPCRLLLASDGAYEPHEDAGHHLPAYLAGDLREAAADFVETAVSRSRSLADPAHPEYVDNATVLLADLRP